MRQIFKNKITWIDINSPTSDDLEYLKKIFHFHPILLKELSGLSQRNQVAIFDNFLFLVTHFPNWNPEKQTTSPWELDVLISKETIITVSYDDTYDARIEFLEQIYQNEFEKEYLVDTTKLFFFIFNHYLTFANRQITHIQSKIDTIEKYIFDNHNEEVIPLLNHTKRDVLNFRSIIRYLKYDLDSLIRKCNLVLNINSKIYFEDLLANTLRIENLIDTFKDTLDSLENTNNSLIDIKINSLSKIYTILSFITWPTLLIISSYQMNTHYMPFIGYKFDYFIILTIAFIPSIIIYWYLKKKHLI
ncbi:MAG: magnesium transporter CorA family protein [Minisyncoccia bacterium]|jgi:magnesium transporter